VKPMDPSWLFREIQRRWGGVSRHHAGYPESYPRELEGTITLEDGARLTVRPIRPDDIGELRAGFSRLSAESVYRRFHAHLEGLSDEACRYLTHVDYKDHLALVVLEAEGGRGVAVARYYRPEGSDLAEAAVVVTDEWQGRGVGPALLDRLVAAARERGILGFEAFVQPDNRKLLNVLMESGYRMQSEEQDDVLRVVLPFEGRG
jgi:GNAT superfamily N-acetyltransferase